MGVGLYRIRYFFQNLEQGDDETMFDAFARACRDRTRAELVSLRASAGLVREMVEAELSRRQAGDN